MSTLGFFFALVAGLFGGAVTGVEGFLLGLIVGYSLGGLIELSSKVQRLEQRLAEMVRPGAKEPQALAVQQPAAPTTRDAAPELQASESQTPEPPASETPASEPQTPPLATPTPQPVAARATAGETARGWVQPGSVPASTPAAARDEILLDKIFGYVWSFFTDGNVVVKVGLLVLFVGVGFLIKYAAEHSMLPVELRVAGIGLAGVVLLVFGWRLRASKRIYALLLQGGGVGVMYLAVFGAARLYELIPIGAAFIVMVALVVLSGILAVLQNARYLAFYGAAGGFLAPVLASTGAGSHVMLFSFYALLNLGILGIAWYRSWRELNLLGFVFTFVIGSLWGAQYYRPEYFASVEPFLILFFVFFVAIAVLFAFRQPPQLKGYVDSTLVFGVPIIAFALQYALVWDMHYGLAFSALGLSAFYIVLATALWRVSAPGMRLLTEAFLAMGVVFGSLAIPLALDGRWTSAAWALEGAAIIWIGVRQNRMLARAFGLLLQLGAGLFFLFDLQAPASDTPVFNGIYLGALLVSVAGLFSSYYLYKHPAPLREWERNAHIPLLVWGLLWWFGAGLREIHHFVVDASLQANLFLVFVTGSLAVAHYLEARLKWQTLRYVVLGQLYAMLVTLYIDFGLFVEHPLADYGWISWPLALGALYVFLYRYRAVIRETVLQWQHIIGFWIVVLLLTWEGSWIVNELIGRGAWRDAMFGLVPALLMLALLRKGRALRWPLATHYDWYAGHAALPVMVLLGLFALGMGLLHDGAPSPVGYLPLANPVDIIVALILYLLLLWRLQLQRDDMPLRELIRPQDLGYVIAGLAFAWLNGIIARSVHHWFGVAHDIVSLSKSVIFQASISVIWTLVALSVMWLASRKSLRELWFAGLGLFIVVVIKLFLVDISRENELVMIFSLIMVAALAIVFGYYLSPLPPRKEEKQA